MFRKPRKNILSRLFFNQKMLALVGFIIIVLISIPLAKNISQRYKINQQVKELEQEIANLQNKNSALNQSISYLESDQFVEEQARLKLGLKKPDEQVAVVQTSPNQSANSGTVATSSIFNIPGLTASTPNKPITNPERWWQHFFK